MKQRHIETPAAARPQTHAKRWIVIITAAALAVIVYYALPSDMNELARRTAAIFVIATIFWATEVLPLFATSLCVIGLEILFLADNGGLAGALPAQSAFAEVPGSPGETVTLSYADFLESFASPIIILFMGGFLLSAAVTKHGLDRIIGGKFLRPFCHKPIVLLFAVLGITGFFSMWMSNTATTAMMLAIVAPILRGLPSEDRFHRALVLAVAFGANVGGMATPIGTPPNAVAMAAMVERGIDISFLDWMILALPLTVLLLIITGFLLYWMFPPVKDLKMPTIEAAGDMTWRGRATLGILVVTILLWLTGKLHGIDSAVIALFAAAALTSMRVLEKHDVDSIDWNVLILMWGGLSLGNAMQMTGLVEYIVTLPFVETITTWPGPLGGIALVTFVALLAVGLSTFMSNTATAALLVPMAFALSPGSAGELTVLVALSCSLAMAMPVSTPPNAIAFATGRVPVTSMIRAGGLISAVSIAVMLTGFELVLPLFLRIVNSQ